MRTFFTLLALAFGIGSASLPARAASPELESVLNQKVWLPALGHLAFRGPKAGNQGPALVLMHGVYGGASHRAFRELFPRLDAQGYRVFLLDLIGTGESNKPKRVYAIEDLEQTLEDFLQLVVQEPATVVAESLSGVAALEVSKRSKLVAGVVMLQPTGVRTLGREADDREQALFERLWRDDKAGIEFYRNLLNPESVRFYLRKSVYNDALIDDLRVEEATMQRENLEQRWITLSFVGGQIWKPFAEAAEGVTKPVLAVFGEKAEAIGPNPEEFERAEEFRALRADFQYAVLPDTGASVQRERPNEVAALIRNFLGR